MKMKMKRVIKMHLPQLADLVVLCVSMAEKQPSRLQMQYRQITICVVHFGG